jgi:hypothetical protein
MDLPEMRIERRYLMTDLDGRTRRGFRIETGRVDVRNAWNTDIVAENIWECGESPLLAVMANPVHVECVRPRLFQLSGNTVNNAGVAYFQHHRIREIDIPSVSAEQKLVFAMYCVRTLSPEHAFAAWAERWLAKIDRSVVGAKLVRHEIERAAEQTDKSLAALSGFWVSKKKLRCIYENEFEFLRRARDVVDAAITLIEKPRQWQVTLAELVATATSGLLDEKLRSELAELAVRIIPGEESRKQRGEPDRLSRRRDDEGFEEPKVNEYIANRADGLSLAGTKRDPAKC